MKLLPSAVRQMLITLGLVVGLVAAVGGVAVAATPTATGVRLAAAASPLSTPVQPTWNNDNWDHRDRNRSHDRDRDRHHNGHWSNPWRWKRWVVSPWQCHREHGHVEWRQGRCWGGRFNGAWIRNW